MNKTEHSFWDDDNTAYRGIDETDTIRRCTNCAKLIDTTKDQGECMWRIVDGIFYPYLPLFK